MITSSPETLELQLMDKTIVQMIINETKQSKTGLNHHWLLFIDY